MPKFNITATDVLRSKLVDPGWYPVKVIQINEKTASQTAKNPGSLLIELDALISKGPYQGVPLTFQFSEVAPGFAIPFFNAILPEDKQITEKNPNMPDFSATKGVELEVNVINDKWNNRYTNKVIDFRPLKR